MRIEERDSRLIEDLFEIETSQYNEVTKNRQKKIISEGVSIQYQGHFCCDSTDTPSWLIISIEIGKNVVLPLALSILSSYLYDKLKDKKNSRVVINNQLVEIDAKKIEKLILTNVNIVFNQENVAKETEKK